MQAKTSKEIKIATRGSKLALWQSNYVAEKLRNLGFEVSIKIMKTAGDRIQDRFLHDMGGKGLFVKELEQAMLQGKADIAVHSLKDLPAVLPEPFCLPAILKRHRPSDALIFSQKAAKAFGIHEHKTFGPSELSTLGPMTLATASLRRQSILRSQNQDISLVAVRGNVDTRLRKLEEYGWDGIILAEASLERLQLEHLPYVTLALDWFVPCAAQGALAIECHKEHPAREALEQLSHDTTMAAATIERAVLAALGGDCTMPFGCYGWDQADAKGSHIDTIVADYSGQISRHRYSSTKPLVALVKDLDQTVDEVCEGLRQNDLEQRLSALSEHKPDLGPLF